MSIETIFFIEYRHHEDTWFRMESSYGPHPDFKSAEECQAYMDKLTWYGKKPDLRIASIDPWKQLENAVAWADWYYNYADDGRAYRAGQASVQKATYLYQEMKKVDAARADAIWARKPKLT